jgi:hypothetical protein
MTLQGNVLDVSKSITGINVPNTSSTVFTFDLDVIDIINDSTAATTNIVAMGTSTLRQMSVRFQRCYVYTNGPTWFATQYGSLSIFGDDMRLLVAPGVPLITTQNQANLLARFKSVQCPSQALLMQNTNITTFPSIVDYFSQKTISTYSTTVGSPPVAASPLFDIRPVTGATATVDLFICGGYNNAGSAPVIQFIGPIIQMPNTRVYGGSILVSSSAAATGPGNTITIGPISTSAAVSGVTVVPAGAMFTDPSVQ